MSTSVAAVAAGLSIAWPCFSEATAVEQSISITTKSYIARMGPPADQRDGPPSEATKKALGFEGETMNRSHALLFMYLTDDHFSEDPKAPDPAHADYRLWSHVSLTGTCDAQGNLSAWYVPGVDTRFGKEGSLDAVGKMLAPLVVAVSGKAVSPTEASRGPSAKSVALTYAIEGRPNDVSIAAFTAIRPRACTWIWHRVASTISCLGGKMTAKVSLTTSAFPSARTWINGALTQTYAQGPFEDLWMCDAKDHSLVR